MDDDSLCEPESFQKGKGIKNAFFNAIDSDSVPELTSTHPPPRVAVDCLPSPYLLLGPAGA
jgi:hypothetical protein